MPLSATQQRIIRQSANAEYISAATLEEWRQAIQAGGTRMPFVVWEEFVPATCPGCAAEGIFRFHFLGRLRHPDCNTSWYLPPGTYSSIQLRAVFSAGMDAGVGMKSDSDRKGERGGWLVGAMGFLFGSVTRLVFAVVMIPIQAVLSLSQDTKQLS